MSRGEARHNKSVSLTNRLKGPSFEPRYASKSWPLVLDQVESGRGSAEIGKPKLIWIRGATRATAARRLPPTSCGEKGWARQICSRLALSA